MNFHSLAVLPTSLPEEIVEYESGEVVDLTVGKIAEAIAEMLEKAGYQIDPAEFAHDHGWDLMAYVDEKPIFIQVQIGDDPGEYYLSTEARVWFFRRLMGVDLTYYAEFLTKLNELIKGDPRFETPRWYETRNGVTSGDPADEPLQVMDWRDPKQKAPDRSGAS